MVAFCPTCGAYVDLKRLEQYEATNEFDIAIRIQFLKCPKCNNPFLTEQSGIWLSDYASDFAAETDPRIIFPAIDRLTMAGVPEGIALPHREAVGCLAAGLYTATAVMCRKTLEAICHEHASTGSSLATRLKGMRDSGAIDKRLFDWAEALRIAGNEAAHDIGTIVIAQDARDLMDFTHALIEYLFTFRDKYEAFMQRRTSTMLGKTDQSSGEHS